MTACSIEKYSWGHRTWCAAKVKISIFFRAFFERLQYFCLAATFEGSTLNTYSFLLSFFSSDMQNCQCFNTLTLHWDWNIITKYYAKKCCRNFFRTTIRGWPAPVRAVTLLLSCTLCLADIIFTEKLTVIQTYTSVNFCLITLYLLHTGSPTVTNFWITSFHA